MIIYYDTDTGRIVHWRTDEAEPDPTLGRIEAECDDPLSYCVVDGALVPAPEDTGLAWLELRQERDRRLLASDWTQVADAPVDQSAWATYRQALRDLPDQTTDPTSPEWPVAPDKDQ